MTPVIESAAEIAAMSRGRRRLPGVLTTLARIAPDSLLTLPALAAALERSERAVRRAIERGELPAGLRLAGRQVWLAGSITAHLRERAGRRRL